MHLGDSRLSVLFACALILMGLGAALALRFARWRRSRRGRLHQVRGEQGERKAERLLRRLGYRVCERQVAGRYPLRVDGAEQSVEVVADLLVEHRGQLLVAEVKTGHKAPQLGYADTRRQLLEYQLAFGVPAVLLVDVEGERVREVRFPLRAQGPSRAAYLVPVALGSVALVLASLWLLRLR